MVVNRRTPKLSVVLSGIILISSGKTSFVLVNERSEQKRYSLNKAPESALGTLIRKISKTDVVLETHEHYEKVTLHPRLPDIIKQPSSEDRNVLTNYIIATPIRDGGQIYGLQLNLHKGLDVFTISLLQPGGIALKINNLSLAHPDEVSQTLSLLLTQQSTQFTIRHNGISRPINVSIGELTGINGLRHERTQ